MNKGLALLASAALALTMAACAGNTAAGTVVPGMDQEIVEEFQQNGFTVEDLAVEGDTTEFKVVGDNGGANVEATVYDNAQQALDAYDTQKASLTQSDYYMMSENQNDQGSAAIFNNSINYVDAIALYDRETNTVIVAREISQANMETFVTILAEYGLAAE